MYSLFGCSRPLRIPLRPEWRHHARGDAMRDAGEDSFPFLVLGPELYFHRAIIFRVDAEGSFPRKGTFSIRLAPVGLAHIASR